ncbi:MAG: LON peptidase substrate-binding domain-containing protein [Chloroflexi bacterium]|nr:LON peptidase substrate-binding domain-containing protein [Chloroflexota bacterium]
MSDTISLPLFPLNTVLFPNQLLPLHIFEERYKLMIGECIQNKAPFGVVLIRAGREAGGPSVPFEVGTTARIADVQYLPQGRMNLRAVGEQRFRLERVTQQRPYMRGDATVLEAPAAANAAASLIDNIKRGFSTHLDILAQLSEQERVAVNMDVTPEHLSYLVAAILAIQNPEKQELLEMVSTDERLQREATILNRENRTLQTFLYLRKHGPAKKGPDDQGDLQSRISVN